MPEYRFVTEWRLDAPIDRVYGLIEDSLAWPAWWPSVRAVERLSPGDEQGMGVVDRMTFVGRLPYRLAFDMRVTASGAADRPGRIGDGRARGRRRLVDLLAPLPFVDSIFRLNHHAVMRDGLKGVRRQLGGVEGTYTREE